MDFDFKAVMENFRAESQEGLHQMEADLLALEVNPGDHELIDEVFRIVHTIKGNAASLDRPRLSSFAHELEDVLDHLRGGNVAVTTGICSALLKSVDILRAAVLNAVNGEDVVPHHKHALLREIHHHFSSASAVPDLEAGEHRNFSGPSGNLNHQVQDTLRVKREHLDRSMDLAAEITIAQSRLERELQQLGPAAAEALAVHEQLTSSFMTLQEFLLKMRMVPVQPLFQQFQRIVRDLSVARGKKVRLVVESGEVEVDTSIAEHLKDALMHMVRNAIDHGIESPEQRLAAGKDAFGTITLHARHESGSISIEISDDGAGFDRDKIVARARSKNLVAEAQKLSDMEILDLVFEPGFSTAEEVTDISGRGVGMDVVRRNVDALHGSVRIESRKGEGSTFLVRLPLSLAIIDGFVVKIADDCYVVPMDSVIECMELPRDSQQALDGGVINLRGEALPFLRLRDVFAVDFAAAPERENVLVVSSPSGKAGFAVDALLGKGQTVIKPLGKIFQQTTGMAGSTILGDGRVALILDVPTLVREAIERQKELVH